MGTVPTDCRYTRTHEWVRLEGTTASIGITVHAQESLGDITFVELPAVGTSMTKGEESGVIESVKAASDLYAPVAGKVEAVNALLETTPELVNQDPHGEGWIYRLTGVDPAEGEALMDADAYTRFLESEA